MFFKIGLISGECDRKESICCVARFLSRVFRLEHCEGVTAAAPLLANHRGRRLPATVTMGGFGAFHTLVWGCFLLTALVHLVVSRQTASGPVTPVLGWSTWCTGNECGEDWCTAKEVMDVARYMKENGFLAAGFEYINLDDCWGIRDESTGEIEGDPDRFPAMADFVADIKAMGFKLGVYTDMGVHGCHNPFTGSWPYYDRDARKFAEWGIDYVKFD